MADLHREGGVKILAIETTERIGTVALAEGDSLVAQANLDASQRSAQSLAPALVRILADVGWKADEIDLMAVTLGPGSFTGLRVGLTTAKAFAYSIGAEILGIDTLEAIAARVPADERRVAVAIDAQRGQVAAAIFSRDENGWFRREGAMGLFDVDAWLAAMPDGIAVSGPILKKLEARIPTRLRPVPSELWHPVASMVARLASRDFAEGRRDDMWKLVPVYSRLSAAEEKRDQRGQLS